MGYYSGYQSKEELVAELTKSEPKREVLASSLRGNQLWSVIKCTPDEGENPTVLIHLDLLSKNDGTWGYKPMSEGMHPYYYNCPKKFLKMAPVASKEWRDIVMFGKVQAA